MPQLLEINLPSRVGKQFHTFGTLLLQDDFGNEMDNISEDCRGKPETITREVLKRWLAGKGVEVSWESLIATLKNSKQPFMAYQIQMALEKLCF